MPELMNEQDFKKKQKAFTIIGAILVVLGLAVFLAGPILYFTKGRFYYFFISFIGVFMFIPGGFLLSLGMQRKLLAYQAQAMGPVSVEATREYGAPAMKEMSKAAKEGFTEDKQEVYCKYCGGTIDDDSEFCKFCGKKLK